jgi:hypothetical protein
MFFKRIAALIIISASLNAYAIEPVAKEDTMPPPAESALSVDKIPPIMTAPSRPAPVPAAQPGMMPSNPTLPGSSAPTNGTLSVPTATPPGAIINTQPTTSQPSNGMNMSPPSAPDNQPTQ